MGSLYTELEETTIAADSQWSVAPSCIDQLSLTSPSVPGRSGSAVEYRQDLAGDSRYQELLEEELLFMPPDQNPIQSDLFLVDESTVRYWSDYNRVDYHPRSIQKLPDLFDWDSGMGDWSAGKEMFDQVNNKVNVYRRDCVFMSDR